VNRIGDLLARRRSRTRSGPGSPRPLCTPMAPAARAVPTRRESPPRPSDEPSPASASPSDPPPPTAPAPSATATTPSAPSTCHPSPRS